MDKFKIKFSEININSSYTGIPEWNGTLVCLGDIGVLYWLSGRIGLIQIYEFVLKISLYSNKLNFNKPQY
jgi:hypothetical protein